MSTARNSTAAGAAPLNTMRSAPITRRLRLCKAATPSMKRLLVASAVTSSSAAYQGKEGLKTISDHAMTTYCPFEKKAPDGVRDQENRATGHSAASGTP